MLEYTKNILQKINFDKDLFDREIAKASKWLSKDELKLLHEWVRRNQQMADYSSKKKQHSVFPLVNP
ncbi:MAG: hypothetical protein ACOYMF_07330 [Bacteroidales bacterium]